MIRKEGDMAETEAKHSKVVPISKLWWVGLLAIIGVTIINLLFFWITRDLLGVPYYVPVEGYSGGPPKLLSMMEVIVNVNLVPGAIATIVLAFLGIFLNRPFLMFWIILVVFLLMEFILQFASSTDIATSTRICLNLMNIIMVLVMGGGLTKFGRVK